MNELLDDPKMWDKLSQIISGNAVQRLLLKEQVKVISKSSVLSA